MLNPHFDLPFRFAGSMPSATNLIPNGGYENNVSVLTATANLTVTRYDPIAGGYVRMFGTSVCNCQCTDTASAWINHSFYQIPIVAGQSYTASNYVFRRLGVRAAFIQIGFYDAATNNLIYYTSNPTYVPVFNGWERLTISGVAPVGAAGASVFTIFPAGGGALSTDNFFVDGTQFELGSVATPYVDTNGAPASRVGNVTAVLAEQGSFEDVGNCVEAIVRTPLGYRNDAPDFGFPELELLEQPILTKDVVEIVQAQEPRALVLMQEHPDALDVLIDRITVKVG